MSTSSVNLSSILSSVNNAFSGKTSGIDVASTVAELMQIERQPEAQMQSQQSDISQQISMLGAISNDLQALATVAHSLSDINGGLQAKTVTSTRDDVVTATADTTAAIGNHTVTVTNLATVSSSYSNVVPSTTQLGGGEIDVAYGDPNNPTSSDKIMIPTGDDTLQQVASYINSSNYGVTASVVTDTSGSRLSLVSKTSGAAGNLTVTSPALTFTQGTAGVDAQLTVDGVPIDSATNTVTTALPGVTLNLASSAPGTPVTISVGGDTAQATQTINNFVSAYNAVVNDINSQFTLDGNAQEGPLASDSGLRSLQNQLLSAVSYSVSGTGQYVNLQSLGIEMQDNGTLQVNSKVLNDALTNHYQDFQNFFQSLTPKGFGNFFNTQMMQMTDVTEGPLALSTLGLQETNQSLSKDINDFEARMSSMQTELTQQYSTLNATLVEYPILMQQIASQLSSLPTTSSKSS
ncbi:MAG: flagellar filament capping protein FliD [Candidatus Korobacteraceae bacterium]